MIFRLYEPIGKYANKNLLNANVTESHGSLDCIFYFGKDYQKTFGNDLNEYRDKPVVEINLVNDDSDISGLMPSEDDEIFDKDDEEYDRHSIFTPLAVETPTKYKYRLSAFYVLIKEKLETEKEKEFFRGVGHSLLCWIFSEANLGSNSILSLEASGDGDQEELVKYYTKLGFKTCSDLSNVPRKWYDSASASGICMYSTVNNLNNICDLKKRSFKALNNIFNNPFKSFRKY